MEKYKIEIKNGLIFSPDFPDAEKIIIVQNPSTFLLADYALFLTDLDFSLDCINKIGEYTDTHVRRSLFDCSLVYFFKCFGKNEAREKLLIAENIFQTEENLKLFNFFKKIRDKHIVHDENTMSECAVGAILNREHSSQKIAKILCSVRGADLLSHPDWHKLSELINLTKEFIKSKFDPLCDQIIQELESVPYQQLLMMDQKKFTKENIGNEDVTKKRKKI